MTKIKTKEFDLGREKMREILFRKGLIVDDYNKETDELFKKITDKGKSEIKEILKDPEYRRLFKNMIKDDLRKTKPEFRAQKLNRIMQAVDSL